jgi:hypothetical protein
MIARIGRIWPKVASGAAILAVAAVAGLISYSHIYELTVALHQTVMVARLMPFGVDGLIMIGSVVLLQADAGQRWLSWLGVGPGVAISLFANIESGIRYGWLSATWAGIPAVSFFLACFILENWIKAQAKRDAAAPEPHSEAAPESALINESASVPSGPVPVLVTAPRSAPKAPPTTAPRARAKSAVKKIRTPTPAEFYAADLAAGRLPSIRQVKADLHVGQERAKAIHGDLEAALAAGTAVAA